MKLVYESLGDLLKPKGPADVLEQIKNLSVDRKIEKIKEMEQKWGAMYKNLLNTPAIVEDIRSAVLKELNKLSIIEKVNYIEKYFQNSQFPTNSIDVMLLLLELEPKLLYFSKFIPMKVDKISWDILLFPEFEDAIFYLEIPLDKEMNKIKVIVCFSIKEIKTANNKVLV